MDVHTYHMYVSDVPFFLFAVVFVSFLQIQGWLWLKKTCVKKTEYLVCIDEKIRRDYTRMDNCKMLH